MAQAQADNPYPLLNSIHISSSITVRLTDSNFLLWKPQLEALLSSQKLLAFVTGQEPRPPATVAAVQNGVEVQIANPRVEAWKCTDQLIKSWLYSTLSEEVLGCVVGFATSREIWVYLSENYNRRTIGRVFELRRSLQMLNKRGKSLSEYCRAFRSLCDQLGSIGEPVEETMKIISFLNGLGREYDPIITVIQSSLSRAPIPTLMDVMSEVSGYDARLQTYEEPAAVTPHLAFQVNDQQGGRGRGRSNRGRAGYSSGRSGFSSRGRGFSQQVSSNTRDPV